MAELTKQVVVETGLVVVPVAAAAGGDEFLNNGKMMLKVVNGGGSACVVTITAQNACDQGVLHDGGGSVAAGTEELFGPFNVKQYNDGDQMVAVGYDQVTTVTVAVIELPEAT